MQIYRLYLLNPQTGGIDGFEEISASNDHGAIGYAGALGLGVPTELWLGSRKVGRFDPALEEASREPVTCPA